MARGRSAGYDDQRDMILEHAALLFANRGYSATSMNQVAEACGFSKALLYHYYRDKYSLLVSIAENHVSRLEDLVSDLDVASIAALEVTEDVKFLQEDDRERVLGTQRTVVAGFARVVAELRPDLEQAALAKPLTMLLFGMINWMFIWMRPDGELDYDAMAPVVADLFLGGLPAVQTPVRVTAIDD